MLLFIKACKFWLKNCKIRFFQPRYPLGFFYALASPANNKV